MADTGPVAGETFAQKVERLKKVSAAVKQRAEAGGDPAAASPAEATAAVVSAATDAAPELAATETPVPATPVTPPAPAVAAKTGQADRTLMKRHTYCGVVDTGPVPGETFEQKVERLRAVSAAAKQRADEGGAGH